LILGDGLDQFITLVAEVSCLACSDIAKGFADVLVSKIAKAAHQKGRYGSCIQRQKTQTITKKLIHQCGG